MYYDYYLNTPDEASMLAALQQAEATDADGNPFSGVLIDVIGTHYERTGGTEEESVYTQVPGWHVNVRSDHELRWPEGVYAGQPHAPWRSFGPLPKNDANDPQPPQAVVQTSQVDLERDRRISSGFYFNGVLYQSRLPSYNQSGDWDVFSGKALEAFIAISEGSQRGDLRWSDPEADFTWIAADNSRIPMDAFTVIELCKAASVHRSRHTFSASNIKAMNPIPEDFKDDRWWV